MAKKLQDIAAIVAERNGMGQRAAEKFVNNFFQLIRDGLKAEKTVKIKGLGTFKIIDVEERESVNVTTGRRFTISGHSKLTFTPEQSLKELVNKPFSQFETVVLNDGVDFNNVDVEDAPEPVKKAVVHASSFAEEKVAQPVEEVADVKKTVTKTKRAPSTTKTATKRRTKTVEQPKPEPAQEPVVEPIVEVAPVVEAVPEPAVESADEPILDVFDDPTIEKVPEAENEQIMKAIAAFARDDEEEEPQEPEPTVVEEPESVEEEPQLVEAEEIEEPEPFIEEIKEEEFVEPSPEPIVTEPETKENEPVVEEVVEHKAEKIVDETEHFDNNYQEESFEDDVPTEPEEESSKRNWLKIASWIAAIIICSAFSFMGGYMLGKRGAKPAEETPIFDSEPKAVEAPDPIPVAPMDTENSTEEAPPVPAKSPTEKTEEQAVSEDDSDYKKYEEMDARVRHGAYRIVGTDFVEIVREGDNTKRIAKRTLGEGMECYIEVYNGITADTELVPGQQIKIPKVKWKKK